MPMPRRSILAVTLLAAALTAGCMPLPPTAQTPTEPDPVDQPPIPTDVPEPSEPITQPTTEPDPDPQPTQLPGGELPTELSLEQQLPEGFVSGWATSIPNDTERFEPLDDNDFPAGPTISVHDTQEGCLLWAYNSLFDAGVDDLTDTTLALMEVTSQSSGSELTFDTLDFGPNPTQGITVEFAVLESTDDRGTWAVRVYGSIASAQYVQAVCETPEQELDYLEMVADGLLVPDFV